MNIKYIYIFSLISSFLLIFVYYYILILTNFFMYKKFSHRLDIIVDEFDSSSCF
jgi:hypothetical protein